MDKGTTFVAMTARKMTSAVRSGTPWIVSRRDVGGEGGMTTWICWLTAAMPSSR